MHRDRPVTQFPLGAVPATRPGLLACLMLLLGVGIYCVPVLAAQTPGDKPAASQAKEAAPSEFVGGEVCATCHEEAAKKFADNPHAKMALLHGNNGVTCENCHGAGKAHVDGGGDITKIFNPAKATPKEVDAKCLTCHAAASQL